MLAAIISGILLIFYCGLLLYYRYGWFASSLYESIDKFQPVTSFTIVIPARNEAGNIIKCLESINKLDYPAQLLEIIVVDDHSEDDTCLMVSSFPNVKLIKLSDYILFNGNSYKKHAITLGVQHAKGSYIITTDADCIVPPNWLRAYDAVIQNRQSVFIAAPVAIIDNPSLLNKFETLDFMMLQGITAAAVQSGMHAMSNGANLCFQKKAFMAVDGYANIDHIASGDDLLLMQKIEKQFPGQTHYCKSKAAVVLTNGSPNILSFLQQRIRWASKGKYYEGFFFKSAVILVFLLNCSFLFVFAAGFFNLMLWSVLVALILLKTSIELIFLYPVSLFFGKTNLLWMFLPLQLLHIPYMVIAGFLGNLGKYQWKGRIVR
jgi:cellulose synthase/poly-beta-1,6-N-acetylglucosamine synthase-like glycosyltransferase